MTDTMQAVAAQSPVYAARNAYIQALRDAGKSDMADLMAGLNARTWTGDDAEPGARTARYVVELHGVTVDVAVNADHTAVDINTEETPAGQGPVWICLGDTLLDEGENA